MAARRASCRAGPPGGSPRQRRSSRARPPSSTASQPAPVGRSLPCASAARCHHVPTALTHDTHEARGRESGRASRTAPRPLQAIVMRLRAIANTSGSRRHAEPHRAGLSRRRATQILRVVLRIPDFTAFSRLPCGDFHPIFPNLQAQPAKEAHVDVGQPYQRETCDEIASPVIEQQLVTGDEQEEGGDVVTEAILAREQVEELARV